MEQLAAYAAFPNLVSRHSVFYVEKVHVFKCIFIILTFKKLHPSWWEWVLELDAPLSACWKQQVDISVSVNNASIKIKAYLKMTVALRLSKLIPLS